MMNITKVRVSLGATINLGNYESLRLEYSQEAELTGTESPVSVIDTLRDGLAEKIQADLIATNGGRDILLKKKGGTAS